MDKVFYIDRLTGEKKEESVYFGKILRFLYGSSLGRLCAHFIAHCTPISFFYGWLQTRPSTKRKIASFVNVFEVDPSEFVKPIDAFDSFNDFFIRKLKKEARPLASDIILPADGRYLCYQNMEKIDGFLVKGKKFCLERLLQNRSLATHYQNGSMAMARLCPTDYHRFHFPCDCIPSEAHPIAGPLFSVNPIAVKQKVERLVENKRVITFLETQEVGQILFIEVGATHVGSIHQTYQPKHLYRKGDEKGFFSFGGSLLILLFEPERIVFDADLIKNSLEHFETRAFFGQSLGKAV